MFSTDFVSFCSVEFETEQGGLSADVIKKAFNATEEDFTLLVRQSFPVKPQIASVGSCCLLGAISNNELYVANLGDSRAVLGRKGFDGEMKSIVAERLTTDHNVSCEKVRMEVEALHSDGSPVVVYCRGVWRIMGIIQVTANPYLMLFLHLSFPKKHLNEILVLYIPIKKYQCQ